MASMEEEARELVHGPRRLSVQEKVRLQVREIKLRVLREKLDPLFREFAETAGRLGLPPTRPAGTSPPDGADWVLDLPFWYDDPTIPQPVLAVAVWRDGRWELRREPEDVHLEFLGHEKSLRRMREALVRALARVV